MSAGAIVSVARIAVLGHPNPSQHNGSLVSAPSVMESYSREAKRREREREGLEKREYDLKRVPTITPCKHSQLTVTLVTFTDRLRLQLLLTRTDAHINPVVQLWFYPHSLQSQVILEPPPAWLVARDCYFCFRRSAHIQIPTRASATRSLHPICPRERVP